MIDLNKFTDRMVDKDFTKKSRQSFLKELNKDIVACFNSDNYTYGESDSASHKYSFQLKIDYDDHKDMIKRLKRYALNSNFSMETYSELDLFITRAFRRHKLSIGFSKPSTKKYQLYDFKIKLDDPRTFNPKVFTSMNLTITFSMKKK